MGLRWESKMGGTVGWDGKLESGGMKEIEGEIGDMALKDGGKKTEGDVSHCDGKATPLG